MTQPKLTPEGAAARTEWLHHSAYDLAEYWNAIAAAAIKASRSEPTPNERESAWEALRDHRAGLISVEDTLVRIRAAVRAECQAEIERLKDELEVQTVGHRGAVDGWNDARADIERLTNALRCTQVALRSQVKQKETAELSACVHLSTKVTSPYVLTCTDCKKVLNK